MEKALADAMGRLESMDPQVRTEVIRGVYLRKKMDKDSDISVLTVHYSANPDRDPLTPQGAEWYRTRKAKYPSESKWNQEQELDATAGGGELVFARALNQFTDKVVITDPDWKPDPRWDVVAGFDYGGTNATAFVKAYVDFQGNVYACGEYYSFKREKAGEDKGWDNEVWQNAPEILKMPDIDRLRWCMADPNIFPDSQVTPEGKKSAINQSFIKNGIRFLRKYEGERSDVTFVEYVLSHYWKDLEHLKPKLYIVCREESIRPQPGLHPWDCPNLLWELKQTKRAQLTASQMLTKNRTEKIIDRRNHARDALKYLLFTLRRPTAVDMGEQLRKTIAGLNPTSAQIAAQRFWAQQMKKKSKTVDMRQKARMRR
jgi:hypothetical protein